MRCFQYLIMCALFTLISTVLPAQNQSKYEGNFIVTKIINGMNAAFQPLPGVSNTEITLYIKTGSVHDNDSLSGRANMLRLIHTRKIEAALLKGTNRLSYQNTQFLSYTTSEQAIYKFTTNESNLTACMTLLRDSVLLANISKREIDSAVAYITAEIDSADNNVEQVYKNKLTKGAFKQDYYRVTTMGKPELLRHITPEVLKIYRTRYYVPNNSIISIIGKVNVEAAREQFEAVYNRIDKSEFDPETITKIIDFHPIIYNTQFVTNNAVQNPHFEICWQFPGTTSNQRASYCAYLLSAILNDKNNFLQVKAAKLGCREFTAQYEANSFSGVLRITLEPNKDKLYETYKLVIDGMYNLYGTLMNETMVTAGKVIFAKEYNQLRGTTNYADFVIKHWPFNDEFYFLSIKDTLANITDKEMQRFAYEYLHQGSYVAGLMISEEDRTALNVDSLFTDLNEDINDYVFTYRQNITDLEGDDNLKKQDKLVQWLKVNKDIYAKINGCADEGEFNKTYDDSIKTFIDSVPTFRRTMPEIIKQKHLRPEMMRAMKIIKYLYDHGISEDRLSGTSIRYKSDNEAEAAKNMKVTVSLDKLRKLSKEYIAIPR